STGRTKDRTGSLPQSAQNTLDTGWTRTAIIAADLADYTDLISNNGNGNRTQQGTRQEAGHKKAQKHKRESICVFFCILLHASFLFPFVFPFSFDLRKVDKSVPPGVYCCATAILPREVHIHVQKELRATRRDRVYRGDDWFTGGRTRSGRPSDSCC